MKRSNTKGPRVTRKAEPLADEEVSKHQTTRIPQCQGSGSGLKYL